MWKPIQAPGEWLAFLTREDNKSLPIMEARKKYMQEQLLFEAYESNVNTVNTVNSTTSAPASAAAGGGGLAKFKYSALFELVVQKGSDTPGYAGTYDRVTVSQLKQYWYDNFYVPGGKFSPAYFIVPPPPSPDVNLGSDFVFIHPSSGKVIAWGRPKTRGRQRGQWTIWQFVAEAKQPVGTTPNGSWQVFTAGPTDLKSPSGTYLYQIKDPKAGKVMVYYTLREKKAVKPPTGTLTFAHVSGANPSSTMEGVYLPAGDDASGNPYWTYDYVSPKGGTETYKIYYSINCNAWKLDTLSAASKVSCNYRVKPGPSTDSPIGTYTITDSTVKPISTSYYEVS